MKHAPMTRAYALGLGYGSLWLVLICTGFAIGDAITLMSTRSNAVFSLMVIGLLTGGLLFLCGNFLRQGYTLPQGHGGRTSVKGLQLFGLLVMVEVVAIATINIVLVRTNHTVWTSPVNLFIIGAHFIPLAFVFRVPAYLFMGFFWLVAILGIVVFVPSTTLINNASVWNAIPSLACIGITWLTVLFIMTTEMKAVSLAMHST